MAHFWRKKENKHFPILLYFAETSKTKIEPLLTAHYYGRSRLGKKVFAEFNLFASFVKRPSSRCRWKMPSLGKAWSSLVEGGDGSYLTNCCTNLFIALYTHSLLFCKVINTTAYYLGRYKPSSPVSCRAPRSVSSLNGLVTLDIVFSIKSFIFPVRVHLEQLNRKAGSFRYWAAVRYSASLLKQMIDSISPFVTQILVNGKQVSCEFSVTREKSPNVHKSCPKIISLKN